MKIYLLIRKPGPDYGLPIIGAFNNMAEAMDHAHPGSSENPADVWTYTGCEWWEGPDYFIDGMHLNEPRELEKR